MKRLVIYETLTDAYSQDVTWSTLDDELLLEVSRLFVELNKTFGGGIAFVDGYMVNTHDVIDVYIQKR